MKVHRKTFSGRRLLRSLSVILPTFSRRSMVSMALILCLVLSRSGFILTCSQFMPEETEASGPHTEISFQIQSVSMFLTDSDELCGRISPNSRSGCHCSDEKKRSGTCCCSSGTSCCSGKVATVKAPEPGSCCAGKKTKNIPEDKSIALSEEEYEGPAWIGCICGMTEFSFFFSFQQPMLKDDCPHVVTGYPLLEKTAEFECLPPSPCNLPETPPPEVLS